MGKPTGFKEFERETAPYRNAMDRQLDFKDTLAASPGIDERRLTLLLLEVAG